MFSFLISLGSWHDGNYDRAPDCSGRDQYVMASSPGVLTDENRENPFRFSHCSIRQFREFLFYLKKLVSSSETKNLKQNSHKTTVY